MLSLSKYLFKTCDAVFNLQGITLNESRKLLSDYFVNQLLWNWNEILRIAIFSWYQTIMTIIYQLLQFYLLICMRIQRFTFVITVKASIWVIRSAVRAFTDKFRRSTNRFFQVALCLVLVVVKLKCLLISFQYLYNWLWLVFPHWESFHN